MTGRYRKQSFLYAHPGAVAEHFVRKDPGENKAQGKSNDDQDLQLQTRRLETFRDMIPRL